MASRIASDVRGLFLLSFVCGTWDVAAFYRSLVFVTGMSGNTMILALNLASGNAIVSIFYVCIYLSFVAGTVVAHTTFIYMAPHAQHIITAINVGCVVLAEVVNNIARVPMGTTEISAMGYPLSNNHWSLLFLSFAAATLNAYASKTYNYSTVTFITVTSQKAFRSLADAILCRRFYPLDLAREVAVVAGYALGCLWIAIFNTRAALEGRYWILMSTAAVVLVNHTLDRCTGFVAGRTSRALPEQGGAIPVR